MVSYRNRMRAENPHNARIYQIFCGKHRGWVAGATVSMTSFGESFFLLLSSIHPEIRFSCHRSPKFELTHWYKMLARASFASKFIHFFFPFFALLLSRWFVFLQIFFPVAACIASTSSSSASINRMRHRSCWEFFANAKTPIQHTHSLRPASPSRQPRDIQAPNANTWNA